jgi:hypothetical protein
LVKADIQNLALQNSLRNDRFTLNSRHSAKLVLKDCL